MNDIIFFYFLISILFGMYRGVEDTKIEIIDIILLPSIIICYFMKKILEYLK